MSRIVSSIPGRIRVRDKSLRDRDVLNELKKELSKLVVITELQDNMRTGSVLLRFKRNAIELSFMEASVNSAVDKVIGKPSTSLSLLSKKNLNRFNKIAMLASLGASLALLKLRRRYRRRWHALAGYLFVANLGVHLFTYRKALRRTFRWE